MAYTARKLIANAWYLSGIISRNIQTVTGNYESDGLDLLNAFLAIKTADQRMIPYFKKYSFNAVIGQELYFIPNLLMVETFTFYVDGAPKMVRYSTLKSSRRNYWGSARAENVLSLPFNFRPERTLGGTNFYMYFFPDKTYPCVIFGKFALEPVSLDQDLSLTLDAYYIEYLRYALAEYMCSEYGISFQPQSYAKLKTYEKIVMDISPPDLTIQKMMNMDDGGFLNYGDVNIGKGYRPG